MIIEVNLRPAGGRVPELIQRSTGWDLRQAAIELACGLALRAPAPDFVSLCGIYHCITAERESIIDYGKDPIELDRVRFVPTVEIDVAPGSAVYPVNHPDGQVLGRILAFGTSPSDAWEVIRCVKRAMHLTFQPRSADGAASGDDCSGCWEKGCC